MAPTYTDFNILTVLVPSMHLFCWNLPTTLPGSSGRLTIPVAVGAGGGGLFLLFLLIIAIVIVQRRPEKNVR